MYALTRSLYQTNALRNAGALKAARAITLKVVPTQPETESYEERNARLGRALSPHLTIYKPQLTSMLSITHRGMGAVLAAYTTIIGVGALASPVDFSHYVTMIEGLQLSSGTLITLKFLLSYPFTFHAANGVRHLLWDSGKLLKINEVYSSGYAMVGSSVIMSAILALL